MPWLGVPARWLLPLLAGNSAQDAFSYAARASAVLGHGHPAVAYWLSSLAAGSTVPVWVAGLSWAGIRWAAFGPVALLALPFAFGVSVAAFLADVVGTAALHRSILDPGVASLVASSDTPGLGLAFRSACAAWLGPALPWPAFGALACCVGLFCVVPGYMYLDLRDYLRLRLGMRAPLWVAIASGTAADVACEAALGIGGAPRVAAVVAGAAGGSFLYSLAAAGSGRAGRDLRRRMRRFGRPQEGAAVPGPAQGAPAARAVQPGPPATEPLDTMPSPDVDPDAARDPRPGGEAASPRPEAPDVPDRRPGRIDAAPSRAVPAGPAPADAGAGPADIEEAFVDSEEEARRAAVMRRYQVSHTEATEKAEVVIFHALDSVRSSDSEKLESIVGDIRGHWASVKFALEDQESAYRVLERVGSSPFGHRLLACVRDGRDAEGMLRFLADGRSDGDDEPDAAYRLDMSLQPPDLEEPAAPAAGPAFDPGEFDAGDDEAGDPPGTEGDAGEPPPASPAASWMDAADQVSRGGRGPRLDWVDGTMAGSPGPGPGAAATERMPIRFTQGERLEPALDPREALAGAPPRAQGGYGPDEGRLSYGYGDDAPGAAANRPDATEVDGDGDAVAEAAEDGIGEGSSVELLHPLESDAALSDFLSQAGAMSEASVVDLVKRGPSYLAGARRLSETFRDTLRDLTPEADAIARVMEEMQSLFGLLKVPDAPAMHAFALGLVDMMQLGAHDLELTRSRLGYVLCGPWRRELHAMVGAVIRQGAEKSLSERAIPVLDGLVPMMESVARMFPAYSEGDVAGLIAARLASLLELRRTIGAGVRASRPAVATTADARAVGASMVARQSLDTAAEDDLAELEGLASTYSSLHSMMVRDCVLTAVSQSEHPLRVTILDVMAHGQALLARLDRSVAATRARREFPPGFDLLASIVGSLTQEAAGFREDVLAEAERQGGQLRPARERLAVLDEQLREAREAETERARAAIVLPRARVEAEWRNAKADPVDAILARKEFQDRERETVGNDWLMVDLRAVLLPSGVRVLVHDAAAGGEIARTMLVPVFGFGLEFEFRDSLFVPVGCEYVSFDLRRFVWENRAQVRSGKVQDVKILLLSGSVSREIEDVALSRNLDAHAAVSSQEAASNWWRGSVVMRDDLVGPSGGVGRSSAMLSLLPTLLSRSEFGEAR